MTIRQAIHKELLLGVERQMKEIRGTSVSASTALIVENHLTKGIAEDEFIIMGESLPSNFTLDYTVINQSSVDGYNIIHPTDTKEVLLDKTSILDINTSQGTFYYNTANYILTSNTQELGNVFIPYVMLQETWED